MKRAALRRAGLEPDVTAATPVTTTTTANTALTAPQRRATAPKAARGKIAVKGKVSAGKVQKGARAKKGGKKAVGRPKKKAGGRQAADGDDEGEVEESEPEPKPESEPKPKPKPKPRSVGGGRGKAKSGTGASKVQKTTATKKPSVQTARKTKQKARGKKTAEEEEVKDEKSEPGRESGTEPQPKPATDGKGTAKSRKASNKVQKSVGTRSQPARNAKQKTEGNEAADENVVEDQEPEAEAEPEAEPEPESEQEQRKELARLVSTWKKKPRVPKSTKPKKDGIKAVSKAKKKAKANEVTNGSEPKDQNSVSEGAGKGLDPAVPKADRANKDQAQTPGKEKGKEKASVPQQTRAGFTRAELQEANALEWEEVEEPNLTNEIHPIWTIERFRFLGATNTIEPEIVYSAIAPALRLASLWVERPEYENFWYRLWGGKYEKRKVMMQIVRNDEFQTDVLRGQLVQDESASSESASSNLVRNDVLDSFQCEWQFGPQASGEWWTMEEGIAGFSGCVTTLHDDFERVAYTYQPETTTSERLRFYFFFAVNLVRALVQQVCQFKCREKFGHDVGPIAGGTVFFRNSWGNMIPLEDAWEDEAFGGPISQINAPRGPVAPDGLAAYVHDYTVKGVSPGRVYQSLRMGWISARFSAIHWVDEDGEIELDDEPLWEVDGRSCYRKELAID